jgi:hypothetical protein
MADGKATKIIVPSNLQGLAGLATSLKEIISLQEKYYKYKIESRLYHH